MRILYIHGYLGSANGNSSRLIRDTLNSNGIDCEVYAPSFPVTDHDAMREQLRDLIKQVHYDFVIATSMGALYSMTSDFPMPYRILINPALPVNLLALRENDPEHNTELTDNLLEILSKDVDEFCIIGNKDSMCFLFGTEDMTAPNEKFMRHICPEAPAFYVEMGHRLAQIGADEIYRIISSLK